MNDPELLDELLDAQSVAEGARAYLDRHWDDIVADIDTLVRVPSVEDLPAAAPGSPFGPAPREALNRALAVAARLGLDPHDCDGYIGFADLPGASPTQLGIIGHVDVVPAGPGWHFEPFAVTRKEGYLIGRGVADDKGPIIVALHAVKFWADRARRLGRALPYTVRVLFGANEEASMADVPYYRARYADPAFLFTPDAEFPVSFGEAGMFSGLLTSAPIANGSIREVSAGTASNAVPGEATCVVEGSVEGLARAAAAFVEAAGLPEGSVTVEPAAAEGLASVADCAPGAFARINVKGRSAHASTPELGVSAIRILVGFLLENVSLAPAERDFLLLVRDIVSATDGSGIGIQATDGYFGDLTLVGGVMRLDGNRLTQTVDSRYPTTTSPERIAAALETRAVPAGAHFEIVTEKEPFLIDPEGDAVQALLSAYRRATGEADAQPFTMKGGTYARKFSNAASFGPEKPWVTTPDWVGAMHGADEGASEDSLKEAFRIYALTLGELMALDF